MTFQSVDKKVVIKRIWNQSQVCQGHKGSTLLLTIISFLQNYISDLELNLVQKYLKDLKITAMSNAERSVSQNCAISEAKISVILENSRWRKQKLKVCTLCTVTMTCIEDKNICIQLISSSLSWCILRLVEKKTRRGGGVVCYSEVLEGWGHNPIADRGMESLRFHGIGLGCWN